MKCILNQISMESELDTRRYQKMLNIYMEMNEGQYQKVEIIDMVIWWKQIHWKHHILENCILGRHALKDLILVDSLIAYAGGGVLGPLSYSPALTN